jgi:hypothetical protein
MVTGKIKMISGNVRRPPLEFCNSTRRLIKKGFDKQKGIG